MSSSISATRLALDDLLTAAADDIDSALYNVQVTFGAPLDDEEQELVAMLGITSPTEAGRLLGPQAPRQEQYRIELTVKVYDPMAGNDRDARRSVDSRAWAIADGVHAVVDANRTLSGTVQRAHVVSQPSDGLAHPQDTNGKRLPGWVVHINISVACVAQI